MTALKPETRAKLMQVSTATLCTALFKRGLRNQFLQDVRPLNPHLPGDVVVGNREGVIVIPARIADEIAAEATEMTVFEDFVTEMVLEGRSINGLYPPTNPQFRADFEVWRAKSSVRPGCFRCGWGRGTGWAATMCGCWI